MVETVVTELLHHFLDSQVRSDRAWGGDHHALHRRVVGQASRVRVNSSDEDTVRGDDGDRSIAAVEAENISNRGVDTDRGRRLHML